jgi:hypothetical protein
MILISFHFISLKKKSKFYLQKWDFYRFKIVKKGEKIKIKIKTPIIQVSIKTLGKSWNMYACR